MKALKPILIFLAWAGGILLVVGGALRLFFVDPVVVGHNGMAPTLLRGEQVLMWRAGEPELGSIVICQHPSRPSEMVLGRVIGMAGMNVKSFRGNLRINGQTPDVDWEGDRPFYDADEDAQSTYRYGVEDLGDHHHPIFVRERFNLAFGERNVEPGRIFLLGDNRSQAGHDSRSFGTVETSTCRGTIFMRWKAVDDGGADLGHRPLQLID